MEVREEKQVVAVAAKAGYLIIGTLGWRPHLREKRGKIFYSEFTMPSKYSKKHDIKAMKFVKVGFVWKETSPVRV